MTKFLITNKYVWWPKEMLISEKEFTETNYKTLQKT